MSINSDKDIIQLVIEADNLAAPELQETSREILALGEDAQKAAKELDDLRIKNTVIKSFQDTSAEVIAMREQLVKSEVEFDNLKRSLKETEDATDEQRAAVVKSNIELKAQRKELTSQENAYAKVAKQAKAYGVNTDNVAEKSKEVSDQLEFTKVKVGQLTKEYNEQSTELKQRIIVEQQLEAKQKESQARIKAITKLENERNAELEKAIDKQIAANDAQERLTNSMNSYEAGLKQLHAQREKNELSAADLLRKEQELRTAYELSNTQVNTMRKALSLESDERIRSAAQATKQAEEETKLRVEKERVEAALKSYTTELKALGVQREKDEVSVSDAIIKEAELRKQYNLTDSQVSTMRKAINSATAERIKDAAAAKKQADAENRLKVEQQRVIDALPKYEQALRELRSERDKGDISVSDAIRKEKEIRNQYKLTEAQVKTTKAAVKAESVERIKASKSTDLLTTTTRRLAQAYTVLIAAQAAAQAVTTSVTNYGELESAMVRVEKTTNLAAGEIELLTENLIKLGEDATPTTTNELLKMAEVAGQLGITGTGNLLKMVAAADALEVSTNLAGEEAATLLTRILGMTGEGIGEINGLSSSVVALGNNFAVAEDEIVHMTREIVTGTTSINLGSAAAAAYAATLKETGQTAERSRTALFKMSQGIKSAVQNGGDDLERLSQYTGQTADELERNLGERPEVVLTALINGLGDARERGENLVPVMAAMGITGSEASSVIEALAKNSDRLNEALVLSNKSFEEQNAHFVEAAKAYSTQEAAIGRLGNRFNNLTAEIGRAYSDETDAAIRSATALIDNQGDKIVETMNLFGELGSAIGDIMDTFNNLTNTFGISGEGATVLDLAIRRVRDAFNVLTLGINTTVLGLQAWVYAGAQAIDFFNDSAISDEWFTDYEAKMNQTKESMLQDIKDMENAQADYEGTSSSSYRDLTNALETYKGAITELTEEEQKQIQTIVESGEYVAGQNETYQKLVERLVSTNRYMEQLKLTTERKSEADKQATIDLEAKIISLGKEANILNSLNIATTQVSVTQEEYNKRVAESKALLDSGIITQEMYNNTVTSLSVSLKEQTAVAREQGVELSKAKATIDSFASSNLELLAQYDAGKISATELTQAQTLLNLEYNAARATLDDVARGTGVVSKEMATLDKQIDKTNRDITALKISMAAAGKTSGELATITANLRAEQALLADLTEQRNALAIQENLTYSELVQLQDKYSTQLEELETKWTSGRITKAEYVAESERLNKALSEMDGLLASNTAELTKNNAEIKKSVDDKVEQTKAVKVNTSAVSLELDAYNKLNQTYDFTSHSISELSARYNELQGYINQNNKVSSVWYKNLADTYNLGFKQEQAVIEQTKSLRRYTEQVDSGNLSLDRMNGLVKNSNVYFRDLSGQQLTPLLNAIDEARSKMQSLTSEIAESLTDSQDRLDAALGNYDAIQARENQRELEELQALLQQAKDLGDANAVAQAKSAIALLTKAQNAENKANANTNSSSTSSNTQTSSTGNTTSTTQKYVVELKSPTGATYNVNTADEESANELLKFISSYAEISSQS